MYKRKNINEENKNNNYSLLNQIVELEHSRDSIKKGKNI